MRTRRSLGCVSKSVGFFTLLWLGLLTAVMADSLPQVQFDTSKAGPRSVEPDTEKSVLRDYRFAWASMTRALSSNSDDPLNGPFVGDAKKWLSETVSSQRTSGLTSLYTNQNHRVEAVFYSPEGDLMELHDTVEFHIQVMDGGKSVSDQDVVRHYIVLMTPGADRWVVRQLQAVPQF